MNAREAILEAAICVASRDGLLAMTLDNVAREAGVSKGGLIYHFASKDELVRSMIEHFARQVESAMTAKVADDPQSDGRWVRALIDCCVLPKAAAAPENGRSPLSISGMGKFHASLLAAVAVNPTLLGPLRTFGKKMRDRIQSEDPHAVEQLLLWLALDGLFVWELFGLIDRDDALFEQLLNKIRDKTQKSNQATRAKKRETAIGDQNHTPAKRKLVKKRSGT